MIVGTMMTGYTECIITKVKECVQMCNLVGWARYTHNMVMMCLYNTRSSYVTLQYNGHGNDILIFNIICSYISHSIMDGGENRAVCL